MRVQLIGAIETAAFAAARRGAEAAGAEVEERDSHAAPLTADLTLAVRCRRMLPPSGGELGKVYVLHDSLLPFGRGFAPVPNSIMRGESQFGVTLFEAAAEPDSGPIIGRRHFMLTNIDATAWWVYQRLAPMYEELARAAVRAAVEGYSPLPALGEECYFGPRGPADDVLTFESVPRVLRRWRASCRDSPRPSAVVRLGKTEGLVLSVRPGPAVEAPPGRVVCVREGRPLVACGDSYGVYLATPLHLKAGDQLCIIA